MSVVLDSPDQILESVVVMWPWGHFEVTCARVVSLRRPVLVFFRFIRFITAPKTECECSSVSTPSFSFANRVLVF